MVPDGQAVLAVAHGDLVAEHRADGTLGVADRQGDVDERPVVERVGTQPDELVVEVLVELVLLRRARSCGGSESEKSGPIEDGREVEARCLPVLHRVVDVEQVAVADGLVEAAEAELGEVLAHLLGDELEEVHHVLRPCR